MDNYTNRTKTGIYKFNVCDSFAIWNIKDTDMKGKSLKERYDYLHDYPDKSKLGAFPNDLINEMKNFTTEQWKEYMSQTKYVIVALNLGNKAATDKDNKNEAKTLFEENPFGNFHGENIATSKDYNLAAMIYGTAVYDKHTLLTDSSEYIESDSTDKAFDDIYKEHKVEIFTALYNHLDELGVPKNATIIVCHSKARDQLKTKEVQKALGNRTIQRPTFDPDTQYIPHYSFRMRNAYEELKKGHDTIEKLVK